MLTCCRRIALLLILGCASTDFSARSYATMADDPDLSELQHYTLTMDKVNQYWEIMGELGKIAKDHPELAKSLENDDEKHDDIPTIEKRISSIAPLKGTINEHGLNVHEFVVLQMALFQSSMADAMIPAGPDRLKKAAEANVNPANLEFIDQHKADLEALQKKYMPKEDTN